MDLMANSIGPLMSSRAASSLDGRSVTQSPIQQQSPPAGSPTSNRTNSEQFSQQAPPFVYREWDGSLISVCFLPRDVMTPNGSPMTELRDVTCDMGSHSVTWRRAQVNAPHPNPSPQAGARFIGYLSRRDGRLSWRRLFGNAKCNGRKSNWWPLDHKSDAKVHWYSCTSARCRYCTGDRKAMRPVSP